METMNEIHKIMRDEERSKDSDEGRDDVVGKSVLTDERMRCWDFQQR